MPEYPRRHRRADRGPGGGGCLEDRRLAMLGLRERVIAAICEEEWPHPDNEVKSTTIYERLKRDGDDASEAEVRQVLFQLSEHGDVTLVLEPGRGSGPVAYVADPALCRPPAAAVAMAAAVADLRPNRSG